MKTGDLVKLKDGLKIGTIYGTIELSKSMIFEGERSILIESDGSINIGDWYYSAEMLDVRE